MSPKHAAAYCHACKERVVAQQDPPNHLLHAVITIFSCGLWGLVWLALAMQPRPWICSRCGSQQIGLYRPGGTAPRELQVPVELTVTDPRRAEWRRARKERRAVPVEWMGQDGASVRGEGIPWTFRRGDGGLERWVVVVQL